MNLQVISLFLFSTTFAAIVNLPADSSTIQIGVNSGSNDDADDNQTSTTGGSIEAFYFDYLKALNYEQPKKFKSGSRKLLRKSVNTAETLANYKINEYRTYLNIYFPNAHSDYAQRFIIETYIDQEQWNEVLVGLLKFAYVYQDSPLNGPVLENGSQIIQQEKYYQSNRDELLSLIQGKPEAKEIHDSYFEFLSTIRSLKDTELASIFQREAWEFLGMYSDLPQTSTVLIWLAEMDLANNAPHSALMIYEKLMTLYPSSTDFATVLYQTGTLRQEKFREFEEATANFRQFLEQFPEDSRIEDAQYRIAIIADQELNDWTTAITEYEVLVTQYPTFAQSVTSLLRIGEIQASKLKQKEAAITTYNRLASEYQDNAAQATEALQRAGKLYEKSKAYEDAIKQYMTVHDNYPGTDGALESLETCAKLYEKQLKRNDKAKEILYIIIDDFPDTKSAKKADKRLKKLNK